MSIAIDNIERAILSRVFEPQSSAMTPDSARYFLGVKFPLDDVVQMNALAEKSRQGGLSDKESRELENYCRVGDLLGILQSKARRVLKP